MSFHPKVMILVGVQVQFRKRGPEGGRWKLRVYTCTRGDRDRGDVWASMTISVGVGRVADDGGAEGGREKKMSKS